MKTAGIVLAGGESRRMGTPKSLLRGADDIPLAVKQSDVLSAGGCSPVAIVLGSECERIRRELPPTCLTIENPRWAQGRIRSLQTGMESFPAADAYLFLPIDAVGVQPSTVASILKAAAGDPQKIWRPTYRGTKGHLLWVPSAMAQEMLKLPSDSRVDDWALAKSSEVEVDDPAILQNINTPEEWEQKLELHMQKMATKNT